MRDTPTIRLEANGANWRFAWSIAGTVHRVAAGVSGPLSKAEKRRLIADKTAELALHPSLAINRGSITLHQWRERFMERYERAEATEKKMNLTFDRLEAFFKPEKIIGKIDRTGAKDFARWLEKLTKPNGDPLEIATVRTHLRNCKTVFEEAVDEEELTGVHSNPFRKIPSAVPDVEVPCGTVDMDGLERIFAHCPNQGWKCLFAIIRLAGPRPSEAKRSTWNDYQDLFGTSPVLIVRKPLDARGRKRDNTTKHRTRMVPIPPRLATILREAFNAAPAGSMGPCDGVTDDAQDTSKRAREIVKAAGLALHKPLYDLRKNAENDCEASGVRGDAVAIMFGHSPSIKRKHYTQLRADDIRRITDPEAERAALVERLAQLTPVSPETPPSGQTPN